MMNFKVPFTGEINAEKVMNEINNPANVGLVVTKVSPRKGEAFRYRVQGELKKDLQESRWMRQLYPAGVYDFYTIQKQPQDWSGWF